MLDKSMFPIVGTGGSELKLSISSGILTSRTISIDRLKTFKAIGMMLERIKFINADLAGVSADFNAASINDRYTNDKGMRADVTLTDINEKELIPSMPPRIVINATEMYAKRPVKIVVFKIESPNTPLRGIRSPLDNIFFLFKRARSKATVVPSINAIPPPNT
jgi:hypothetical protein